MADRAVIFCKSFEADFGRLFNLLQSHERWCPEYPLILSIPRADAASLRRLGALGRAVEVIHDEAYVEEDLSGLYGWFQQQICKLSIHRTKIADAYFSIDSDAYFVSRINRKLFFGDRGKKIVYSSLFTKYQPGNDALLGYILGTDRNVAPAPAPGTLAGFAERWRDFRLWLDKSGDTEPVERGGWINRLFEVPGNTSLQPGQILHASFLADMEMFFAGYGVSLAELIRLIPWEYNWYGCWVSAAKTGEWEPSVSPIVHFASEADVSHARTCGVTAGYLAATFPVVQMAARHFEATSF